MAETKELKSNFASRQTFGLVLNVYLVTVFLILYGVATYQIDFWKNYFFYDSFSLTKASCTVSASTNSGPKKVTIPHSSTSVLDREMRPGETVRLEYQCDVPLGSVKDRNGITNMHLGWIFGDSSEVYINDSLRATVAGNDKVVIPLLASDLSAPNLQLRITVQSSSDPVLGLSGNAPAVISSGNQRNSKIFGLEIALQQLRQLYNLLPVLTMSFFLIIGWLLGNRSRLVLTTLFYFAIIASRNLLVYLADFWPWDIEKNRELFVIMIIASDFAMIIFSMEILGVGVKIINRLSMLLTAATIITLPCIALYLNIANEYVLITTVNKIIFVAACGLMIWLGKNRLEQFASDPARLKINKVFLYTLGLFAIFAVIDLIAAHMRYPLRISSKTDIIIPFYIGGIVLYTLSLIEKRYNVEKSKRERIEHDLELAREIQDSMGLPPQRTTLGNFEINHYQIKHTQVAGDWLAVRSDMRNRIVILQIDVTGKGIQAALIVHAIQSLWAESLNEDFFEIDAWIRNVNSTLCRLGEKRPHSTTMGIICLDGKNISYWCMGHTPLFLVSSKQDGTREVKAATARGDVLGLKRDITFKAFHADLSADESVDILLGSDGVFAKGSRTRPREVSELLSAVGEKGALALEACDVNDDRTLVHVIYKMRNSNAA